MGVPNFAKLAAEIWRAYTVDGNPGSGNHEPVKSDIRAYGLSIETMLNAGANRTALINGVFTASVTGNALTIALKTRANADASATDPIYADFRHQTASNGQATLRTISAALSLTVAATSLMGFADGVAGRLWVVLIDDAGTLRLGVINCWGGNTAGAAGTIFPLTPGSALSGVSEGSGGADSAGVVYVTNGVTVTAKPFIVLGYMTWETPLATAGVWSAGPDVIHQQHMGDPLPGHTLQTQISEDGALATGTTTMPFDDTIPQSGEGIQFMTKAITPTSKANALDINHIGVYANSAAVQMGVALFQDNTASALAARSQKITAAGDTAAISLRKRMLAGTVSATTMKIRAGGSAAGTTTFNGSAGGRIYGGVNVSALSVAEIMA